MTKNELQETLMSVIAEYIADEVLRRYAAHCKTALVLYSGAMLGFQDAIDNLKELREQGWKFTIVMSESAAEIIPRERLEKELTPEAIVTEGNPANYRKLVSDNNFVLIPSLTINTAAKVVSCINDNLLTRIISRAMIVGKPIIASIDGCCPDSEARARMGFHVTEAYKVKMRSNLESLRSYGMTLTTSKNLAHKANKVFSSKYSFSNDHSSGATATTTQVKLESSKTQGVKKESTKVQGQTVKLNKNIISKSDIVINQQYSTIVVDRKALVTALAKDEAYKRGIKITVE